MEDRDGWIEQGNGGNIIPCGDILTLRGLESLDAEGGVGIGNCCAAQENCDDTCD